jgi:CBS domain containing-hemolysin-like protein
MESDGLASAGIGVRLGLVAILVLANGFFVAAEFALVAVRRTRIDQLASEGDSSARVVQRALKSLDLYISGTQLGITLASLGLGWAGEPALATIFDGLFAAVGLTATEGAVHSAAAATTAFLLMAFLHIVLGEVAPKSIALSKPESVSKLVVRPLILFSTLASPAIRLLNGASNGFLRLIGIAPVSELEHVHSADELRLIVTQAGEHGILPDADSKMLAGVFEFQDKKVRDVMQPRTEIVALALDAPVEEVHQTVRGEGYSRYPVYRDGLDDVIGVFLAKDYWLHEDRSSFRLDAHVRPALYVPANLPAIRVLDRLRRTRAHMAVVLDEFGGTEGIVTLEDLIEEVVGDIEDEYDPATREGTLRDGVLELAGSLSVVDARADYDLDIPEGDWSTIGGFVFGELGRLAKPGDRVRFQGGELEVAATEGRRVTAVRVLFQERASDDETETPRGG